MGKGRAPCCDKSKVKKGPWSPAEDLRLISFIQKHGHPNWRALPKQAGLLRCGKSCRLRWINYLRPDVKRGNFTPEEEETIIKLHNSMGNKWSKIAAHFPGRTDNEIKNVWNTHLKKRLMKKKSTSSSSSSEEGPKNENTNPPITEDASDGSPPSSSSSSSTKDDDQTVTMMMEGPPESSVSGNHDITDLEIWEMLDSLEDPSPPQDHQLESSQVEWLRFLENELGLMIDSPKNNDNNAEPQKDDDANHNNLVLLDSCDDEDFGIATSLYFQTCCPPSSPQPQHFGV